MAGLSGGFAVSRPGQAWRRISDSRIPIVAGLLAVATAVGVLLAVDPALGLGAVAALFYVPLVFLSLPLGIAVWLPLVFVEYLPGVSRASQGAVLLIGGAWVGVAAKGRLLALDSHARRTLALALLLLVWLLVSLAWGRDNSDALNDVLLWVTAVAVFGVMATGLTDERHVRWIAVAFVAGSVLSVIIGVAQNGLTTSATAIETATQQEGRLQGGAGDPNLLAAGLVPALMLAAGLGVGARGGGRFLVAGSILVLVIGLAATESRGGLIAVVIAVLAALVFFRRHRPYVIAGVAVAAGALAIWFSAAPDAWERVTTFDEGGSGRSSLWQVSWRMTEDHPIVGVGLSNFRHEAAQYTREPGALERVTLVAERPEVVHNAYLQLLSENGIIGLALFLAVAIGCVMAARRAALVYERVGDARAAAMSRAVLVGILAALAASLFLSNAFDRRTWTLFALAVVLSQLAARRASQQAEVAPLSGP